MTNETPKGSNTYHEQQILTASPSRLVVMLYAAAMTSLNKAIKAIEAGDVQGRWDANKHAVEVIEHLFTTLDIERGGDIAADLQRLFPFMIRHLIDVDLHNDPEPAREVIELLKPLHGSWVEIDRQMATGGIEVTIDEDPAADVPEIPAYSSDSQPQEAPQRRILATA
jgi:flagellar protein FliS